ncbi:MAG TPA: membrane protein insertion efficiency factor YidD [Bdellovibrionales bacterium]|nr:membrane protein insertion efficiency factor YidD [Bdellovibrionales bacterium]HCM40723.1 membrane protein insertion efficiency factor YidD [Bdellovibrionales bacterium]
MAKFFDFILLVFSRAYRWLISPVIHTLAGPGYGCRFQPTCGEYGPEALRTHGLMKGIALTLIRVAKCQPFSGKSGFDPVPPAKKTPNQTARCCSLYSEACTPKEAVLSPELYSEKKGPDFHHGS